MAVDSSGAEPRRAPAGGTDRLVRHANACLPWQRRPGAYGISPFSLVLAQQPAEAIEAGRGPAADLLISLNAEEGNLYLVPAGHLTSSTMADVAATAARSHRHPARVVAAYRSPPATPAGGSSPATASSVSFSAVATSRRARGTVKATAAPVNPDQQPEPITTGVSASHESCLQDHKLEGHWNGRLVGGWSGRYISPMRSVTGAPLWMTGRAGFSCRQLISSPTAARRG